MIQILQSDNNDRNENSVNSDQTAPLEAVWSGFT